MYIKRVGHNVLLFFFNIYVQSLSLNVTRQSMPIHFNLNIFKPLNHHLTLNFKIYIGCSGFHYNDWKGTFYPPKLPQSRWFEYYCRYFNTFEVNVSFYRFPPLELLRRWYEMSPPDFIFSVKAPRLITHYKQFHDCGKLLSDFYTTIDKGLKEKLGPVLFQLTPRMAYDEEKLERITKSIDQYHQNILEFRQKEWWNPNTIKVLKAKKISFCGISHPNLPTDVMFTSPPLYYRFHGRPRLYVSLYKKQTLQDFLEDVKSKKNIKQAFVYFNNDTNAKSIDNALYLKSLVGQ